MLKRSYLIITYKIAHDLPDCLRDAVAVAPTHFGSINNAVTPDGTKVYCKEYCPVLELIAGEDIERLVGAYFQDRIEHTEVVPVPRSSP